MWVSHWRATKPLKPPAIRRRRGFAILGAVLARTCDDRDALGTNVRRHPSGCRRAAPLSATEAAVASQHDGLGPCPYAQLVEQVRDVVAHGLLADRQPLADLRVAQPLADQGQDAPLAGGQRLEHRIPCSAGAQAGELEHGFAEALPGRLVLEEDVVARLELDE